MFKVSIIVPVYNSQRYLCQCIDSILCQTFTDFELLLIDDGSTDKSGEICNEYALRDLRIRVYHINNSGANNARLLGVQHANGEYMVFVDSDDMILPNGIENLLLKSTYSPKASIIVGHMRYKHKTISNYQYVIDLLSGECSCNLWSKLYKTEIIKGSYCDIPKEYPMGEDLIQNVNIALFKQKDFDVLYCDTIFYNYNSNIENITHSFNCTQEYEIKFHEFLYEILDRLCFSKKINDKIKQNVWVNWQKARINGFKKNIMNANKLNYQDETFINLKSVMKSHIKELRFDDLLVLYITNNKICRYSIIIYHKILSIYVRFRDFKNKNFNLL